MTVPVALTAGDPAGIGLEIAFKAWSRLSPSQSFLLYCDPDHAANVGHTLGLPSVVVETPGDATDAFSDGLPIKPVHFRNPAVSGTPDPENAHDVIRSIRLAVDSVRRGEAGSLCTNPVSKFTLKSGSGFRFPGQTEFLAKISGSDTGLMMLCAGRFRVVPVTVHLALRLVPRRLDQATVERAIRLAEAGLRTDFGVTRPRLAVAGLNPHAGEGGLIGSEDQDTIRPVIRRLAAEGMQVTGPHPADSLFCPVARKTYDAAVCMYHDQALIPVKTVDFARTVNVTLGLPFVRTSPGHGTAFDIAGTGNADETSLVEALKLARRLSRNRQRFHGRRHG
ncbi:MAG: 4-hydroxythreonine-4-phosphate dehydrogenase PdxA [Paracoccaceae bacterium]|nr:4-hydroxythreonine-4-phosphate dehydrogenase PdxA [Paracoccaceae bacterium]